MKMISVSFVVFTYNSEDIINRTLKSIKNAIDFYPVNYEVIIIDNNSSDETIKKIKLFNSNNSFSSKIIINKKQGLIFSRIKCIHFVKNEYVCFIDDDNFVNIDWIKKLTEIINEYNPDVIGCSTKGISDVEFPDWWKKYSLVYACGKRFKKTGFKNNKLDKFWGAGFTCKKNLLKESLLKMDFLCTGRTGDFLLSGEDSELNYRLRFLNASFYYSNELSLNHFMRDKRLTISYLKRTMIGNYISSIRLDSYRELLSNNFIFKIEVIAIIMLFLSPFSSISHRLNFISLSILRFKELKNNRINRDKIKSVFK